MRFRVVEEGSRRGLAASRDGERWKVLFEGEAGFAGLPDDLLRQGPGALGKAMAAVEAQGADCDPDAFTVLPPLMRAGKFLCVGLNYKAHVEESGMQMPDYPTVFARFNSGLVGHGQPLVKPKSSDKFDYESELAVVIGKAGRHIPLERALDHVAGYTIFNDGSIRDVQLCTPQWTIGKNFDGTGGFGPDLVTADELPAGCKGLRLQGRFNGEVVQDTDIADMVFDVATLVALISEAMTLEPGDVIVTGTPAGVGLSFDPPRLMTEGDVFEVEIEGIGTLRNPVVNEI